MSILRFIYSDFHFFFLSNSVFYPENSVEYLNRISPFESEVWYSNPHFKVENVFTIIRIFFRLQHVGTPLEALKFIILETLSFPQYKLM